MTGLQFALAAIPIGAIAAVALLKWRGHSQDKALTQAMNEGCKDAFHPRGPANAPA